MKNTDKCRLIVILLIVPLLSGCVSKGKNPDSFSVAFLTDIHIQPDANAPEGFSQALEKASSLQPDFIITGGDLIMDALEQPYSRADSLYNLYMEIMDKSAVKIYNTMGNHEIYGIYKNSGAEPSHEEYGEKMFEKRLGKSYYSFDHKGWKFMIINSIEDTRQGEYIGMIDSNQISWIKEELTKTDSVMPIVLSTHIPFISASAQKYGASTMPMDSALIVYNSKQVLDLFKGYNLKLVLQGHLHLVEDINIDGIHFITGGAVCGAWWNGPRMGFEEGFVHLTFGKDDFTWRYVDYGWEVD